MKTNKVKGLMAENGHTQAVIAEMLGITTYALRLKLQGKYEFKASELKKLSDYYNVPVDYFF